MGKAPKGPLGVINDPCYCNTNTDEHYPSATGRLSRKEEIHLSAGILYASLHRGCGIFYQSDENAQFSSSIA